MGHSWSSYSWSNPNELAKDSFVKQVVASLTSTRPVKINPESASIRLMGTRFVLDSYLLDQLVAKNVGSDGNWRFTPSALDLAAVFGSDYAYQLQKDAGQSKYAHYDSQMEKMKQAVAKRPVKAWGSTVYDSWLYALQPMFTSHGSAYPSFMQNDAWTAKALQTGFGSYAELKHDTILYTKQYFAEGGDSASKLAPRNWVEPDPVAYARLIDAATLMRNGLSQRGLLDSKTSALLDSEIELFGFFERIAKDELAGKPISGKDNNRLRYIGGELETLWWKTAAPSLYATATADDTDSIIADIGSSPNGVLEVGTGHVDRIYVLVPDNNGNFQVAAGGVYSYYEFENPPGVRYTDKEWQTKLDTATAPARPSWEKVFLPQ